jgi:hypothetical protein
VARRFHASFDTMTPAQLQAFGLWTLVGAGIVATTGRTGLGVTGTAGASEAANTLRTRALDPSTPSAGFQGFALKCLSVPVTERAVWALLDAAGAVLLALTIAADGKARLYRGAFGTGVLLATSATAFVAAGAFRYLQVGYDFLGNTAQVRSTVTGGATSLLIAPTVGFTTPPTWVRAEFYLDATVVLDDYYVNDANAGLGPSYFSGDVSIVTLRPAAVSSDYGVSLWKPNGGSDKVAPIDDATPDLDATYLYTRTDFSIIKFAMETLADDGRAVDDVFMVMVARAVSSAWLPGLAFSWTRYDGIDLHGFTTQVVTTGYQAMTYMTKAAGGLGGNDPWTVARVNAGRYGMIG